MAPAIHVAAPFDVVLAGGGLQNALIALALLEEKPSSRIVMVERGEQLGGNHTWSFHERDVPAAARGFIEPLVAATWSGYDVEFPRFSRTLASSYSTITSERLREVLTARFAASPGAFALTCTTVVGVEANAVTLDDGTVLRGKLVIDARGPSRLPSTGIGGYQKFVGLELLLSEPSPRTRPLLMDARVPQTDGFRFFYVLPFDERRVLVEDTYFSDTPALDPTARERDVVDYARAAGMRVASVGRRESGVLPMPVRLGAAPAAHSPLLGGYAGGWFHPATAYSLPVALRLALHVAKHSSDTVFGADFERLVSEHRMQARFATWLNRMLFAAFRPDTRYGALERFYRGNEEAIARFYALETTRRDRFQMVCGRPPRGLSLPLPLTRRMAS